jgi:pyridinium-3,5-biscarboxylic acid mononucleotide synthase
MDATALEQLLTEVAEGSRAPDDAVRVLRRLPYGDLGFARIDHHRPLRQGLPEAVYGPGKTPEQCAAIVAELLTGNDDPVVLTRADKAQVVAASTAAVACEGRATPAGVLDADSCAAQVHPAPAGLATVTWRHAPARDARVTIVTAGTGDLPVAGECAAVLGALGFAPAIFSDCGVAGVHRLLDAADELTAADAVVVVAGMEGALASVVGGLCAAPVVAVPTSVGYGSSFEGVTALLAMLSSCASGVSVVGIDNGYGAACAVARVLR